MPTALNSKDKTGISAVPVAVLCISVSFDFDDYAVSELNKPEYNLTNSDIEKSKPQC